MTAQKNSVDKVKTDPFGFGFWLGWILWFAGSLIVAAIVWTALLVLFFGRLEGNELYATWAVSVFGSWFVIVIPFMRKKERIWKRLNVDEERATSVWLRAMGLFIGLLISSAFLWSFLMRDKIFLDPGFHPEWLKAVISTWGILLIPFLIFMYQKADDIYKTAEVRQLEKPYLFQKIYIPKEKRVLPKTFQKKLKSEKPTFQDGYVTTLLLNNGQEISHVFIRKGEEILGLYDQSDFNVNLSEIQDIRVLKPEELPAYEEEKWLRIDA